MGPSRLALKSFSKDMFAAGIHTLVFSDCAVPIRIVHARESGSSRTHARVAEFASHVDKREPWPGRRGWWKKSCRMSRTRRSYLRSRKCSGEGSSSTVLFTGTFAARATRRRGSSSRLSFPDLKNRSRPWSRPRSLLEVCLCTTLTVMVFVHWVFFPETEFSTRLPLSLSTIIYTFRPLFDHGTLGE